MDVFKQDMFVMTYARLHDVTHYEEYSCITN